MKYNGVEFLSEIVHKCGCMLNGKGNCDTDFWGAEVSKSEKKFLEGINKYNSRFCLALTNTWKKRNLFLDRVFFMVYLGRKGNWEIAVWMYSLCYRKIKPVSGGLWSCVFWVSREWIPFSVNNVLVASLMTVWSDARVSSGTSHMLMGSTASLPTHQILAKCRRSFSPGNDFFPYAVCSQSTSDHICWASASLFHPTALLRSSPFLICSGFFG